MNPHNFALPPGLSTSEANCKLYTAIKTELDNFQSKQKIYWWRTFHHSNSSSTFRWTTALYIFSIMMALQVCSALGVTDRPGTLLAVSIFLLLILVGNGLLVFWDNKAKHQEMSKKAHHILDALKKHANSQSVWRIDQYPRLHMPQSPCIQLQWTHRDGHLVNLPRSLLVAGDIITLRPGHLAPAACRQLHSSQQDAEPLILSSGDIFAPPNVKCSEHFSSARFRVPTKPAQFVLLETPYINFLRLCLEKSLNRPETTLNREQYVIMYSLLERVFIPLLLVFAIAVGVIHSLYLLPASVQSLLEFVILRPALVIMPLLPLAFPLYWLLLHAMGTAHLLRYLSVPVSSSYNKKPKALFEEMEEISPDVETPPVQWLPLVATTWSLLRGTTGHLWRSASLLHVLGTLTTLCCVDKKGILSWPNPTPEKVFFLKSVPGTVPSEDFSIDNRKYSGGDGSNISPKITGVQSSSTKNSCSQAEVLDLTHHAASAFGVQFDDANWSNYINNLKPLGLGILLNTCNPETQDYYTEFSDHISCESLYNDAAVPVVNKRCLCELATQIGFTDKALCNYKFKHQVGLFRHVRPEVIQKGRLARSLNIPRLKMPFPNMTSAIIKDLSNGSFQIFSQGTADLVLDACSEFWNGRDIRTLTESNRKRILDFYHRSSLTAHCMAFSYGPLIAPIDHYCKQGYIELPPDCSHIFPSLRSLTSIRSWDWGNSAGSDYHHHHLRANKSGHTLSSESLLEPCTSHSEDKDNVQVDGALKLLGHEVFIGMVTMQYQACPDFVHLVEQLDKSCIRFVHFSKENELRSRVFSEKMGLESGWNCHISLLSEKIRNGSETSLNPANEAPPGPATICGLKVSSSEILAKIGADPSANPIQLKPKRSLSAPILVNSEVVTSTVKFEKEISIRSPSEDTATSHSLNNSVVGVHDVSFGSDHHHQSSAYGVSTINERLEHEALSKSPSRVTESTEQSAPLTFDMSNRAKLPKGINAVRPHLEEVDNVPLLVSLFTDCTPETTREMIAIMQEHAQVICCVGSAANLDNGSLFLQANASIALEPLYPQVCKNQPAFKGRERRGYGGPLEFSRQLISLPCSLSLLREDPLSFFALITEARHYVAYLRISLHFLVSSAASVGLLVALSGACLLPLPLSPQLVAWMILVPLPLLSASLILGAPIDPRIMSGPPLASFKLPSHQNLFFYLGCYCLKFLPSVIVVLLCFILASANFCRLSPSYIPPACQIFVDTSNLDMDKEDSSSFATGLAMSQHLIAILLIFYFVVISSSFVHRHSLIWQKCPFSNWIWALCSITIIILQFLFSIIDLAAYVSPVTTEDYFSGLPYSLWGVAFIWPLVLLPLNELVKRHEIKVEIRHQKRARLEFGTKLGMNSPF